MKKVFVAIISLVLLLTMTTACGSAPASEYEKLSDSEKSLGISIVNSGALYGCSHVGLISYVGDIYLVGYTEKPSSSTIAQKFYPIKGSSVGSMVTGTQITMLETQLLGLFNGIQWNQSAELSEKQETIAKLIN